MCNSDFNKFYNIVSEANEYNPIWKAGWYWINMTEKQAEKMYALLNVHPSVIKDGDSLILPGGMRCTKNS